MEFEPGFCMDEKAAFVDACRRQGLRADQFQFALTRSIDGVGFTVWLDVVLEVIRSDGCRRFYRAPSFGSALAYFENDLRDGSFSAWVMTS